MSENEKRGLQLRDIESKLPAWFDKLTDEEQRNVLKRLSDQDIENRGVLIQKIYESRIAENDLAAGIEKVQFLDHEGKMINIHLKGKTGSGTYDFTIRGGDTKFIIPVLVVIGVIIIGIVLIVALK